MRGEEPRGGRREEEAERRKREADSDTEEVSWVDEAGSY